MAQATANPYRMEAVISNTGVNTQNNVKLWVDIAGVVSPTANFNSFPTNLVGAPNPMNDTTTTTITYTPVNMGIHDFSFWATSDSFPTTDTTTMSSLVTDTVYGVDYDWDGSGTNLGGGYYLGRTCGGQVLANVFDIYENTQLTSISFHVSASSVVGAKVAVEVYEADGQIYLEESDEYTLQAQDIDSWVTVPLLSPYPLFAGTGYMAAVRGTQHPTDTSLISATSNVNTSSYIQDNGCDIGTQGFGYWYTASDALAIRMNFGNVSSVNQELSSRLNIYPNPSNGIFTVENNNQKDINYSIRNVLGQINFRGEINTASNSKVDLSHLNSGIYTIEFDSEYQLFNQKLIIK